MDTYDTNSSTDYFAARCSCTSKLSKTYRIRKKGSMIIQKIKNEFKTGDSLLHDLDKGFIKVFHKNNIELNLNK